ncbi:MAG: SDR family NAD(P)-dependent oxidoreductase [Cyanobacteria bacterium P01_F01_bin.143]
MSQQEQSISPVKRALLAVENMKSKLEAIEYAQTEPIAIVGMSCRFPGNSDSPEAFWELLRSGVDAIEEIPAQRWNIDDYYHPNPEVPGKIYVRNAGLLPEVDQFEPQFFGISPKEATSLDPQQRLLLEVSWEALERAGIDPKQLEDSLTGVFVGIGQDDYAKLKFTSGELKTITPHDGTGNGFCFASGRLSYFLGLQGPSLAIDTACSSSLVAVHLACQSLRQGECNLALAGGVQLMLSPMVTTALCRLKALAPDGRCKTFDASADGYGRGEGCGVIVLKRLSDALADGERILAVIRGSAINHDGPSSGITVPNKLAQEQLLQQALAAAKVKPSQISYIEAHGTGTPLGDPIEVRALTDVLCGERSQENSLAIASVKTNIGHLEAASGIAGLIKVVLQLQHQEIAPHLNLQEPNPHLNWAELPVVVPREARPWEVGSNPRIAGVSSFGFSGTNSHVVISDQLSVISHQLAVNSDQLTVNSQQSTENSQERSRHLLTLSAKTETALQDLARRYQHHLTVHSELNIADVCFTANIGRADFEYRLAIVASSSQELIEKLDSFNSSEEVIGLSLGKSINASEKSKIAFLFTGQGSQYVGMGQELFQTQPVFRETLEKCQEILAPYLEIPLLEIIYPKLNSESGLLTDNCSLITDYAQPAIFAIEYALATLWQSWGIEPDIVMGHSVGEYVAACIAGVFSLEDALTLIFHRGRLMQQLPAGGGMVVLMVSVEQAKKAIAPYAQQVAIAAFNGPTNIVISGEQEALEAICQDLEKQEIKTKALQVSHAFHSHLMEPMLEEFATIARSIKYSQPQINIISNVTVKRITEEIATPEYWVNHVRQPVRFAESVHSLEQEDYKIFLEIGSRPILLGMARQCLAENTGVWLPSLRAGQSDWQQILDSLGNLYVQGFKINWQGFYQNYQRQKVLLPTYPWNRQRYWLENTTEGILPANQKQVAKLHPLINHKFQSPVAKEIFFESSFNTQNLPFLGDHVVYQQVVVPGACHVSLLLAAATLTYADKNYLLEDIFFPQALAIPEGEDRTVQVILKPEESTTDFQVISLQPTDDSANKTINDYIIHATGKITTERSGNIQVIAREEIQARCPQQIDNKELYQAVAERQIELGTSFRWIDLLWVGEGESLCQMKIPETIYDAAEYQLHPALIDSCFQVLVAAITSVSTTNEQTFVPFGIEQFKFYQNPDHAQLWCYGRDRQQTNSHTQKPIGDITLFNDQGQIIAEIIGLEFREANQEKFLRNKQESVKDWLYEIEWRNKAIFNNFLLADYLPASTVIAEKLAPTFSQLVAQDELTDYTQFLEQLESVSIDYVLQAFSKLGYKFTLGQSLSLENFADNLNIVQQQKRLLNRLLQMLVEVGILARIDSQWQVIKNPYLTSPEVQINSLLNEYPRNKAELTLLQRCASQLAQVLKGESDPVQLVFPQGDLTVATQLYQDSAGAEVTNTLVQQTVKIALEKLPAARGVRILEIGAGTGGTTSYILPQLNPEQTEYVFTDISPLFTDKAQEKFQDYSFIKYQTLNIEQAPATQGFKPHQYDLIVAANVIHATADLEQTLAHIKQLLATGGILILLEGIVRQRWVDLIFGLLEGWWKFTDIELRPDYPLLTASEWQKLLLSNAFKNVATIPSGEDTSELLFPQAVIIAQSDDQVSVQESSKAEDWLIFADDKGISEQLSLQLHATGKNCILVKPGEEYQQLGNEEFRINPHNPEDFQKLLAAVINRSPNLYGVVQCWSIFEVENHNLSSSELAATSHRICGTTLSLVQALVKVASGITPRLWLVTQGAQPLPTEQPVISGFEQASLWGLGKAIALEHPELNSVRIDLDPNVGIEEQAKLLYSEITSEDIEDQVGFRDNNRYVARLVRSIKNQNSLDINRLEIPSAQSYRLTIAQRGLLENLTLEATKRVRPAAGEVEIQVMATGLNFLDLVVALGLIPQQVDGISQQHLLEINNFGGECAGQVVAVGSGVSGLKVGDRVIAIAAGSFGKYVTLNSTLVVPQPANITFEQAAAIPVNFLTAYYALAKVAQIKAGERILIHSAAGGTGMAAVQIAQQAGAEVFATASPPKWDSLKSMGVAHIMNSRTLDFAEEVMSITEGAGVDLVLNCLTSGEFVAKSLSVVRPQGQFIEIAKRGVWDSNQVAEVRPDVSYSVVDLVRLSQEQPDFVRSMFLELTAKFAKGIFIPPPLKLFPLPEVGNAFRYMQQAKHIGKIIVLQPDHELYAASESHLSLRGDSTYLITGGLGGLGLLVARWMVERGAKYLVLVGRSQASAVVQNQLQELEQAGAKIVVYQGDVSQLESLTQIFAKIEQSLPPLKGVIHSVGVLDDGVIQQLSWERFAKVMAPKVQGAWHLHQLTEGLPLDFFILFSSAASLFGSLGQSNHSAANAFLDGLAYYRQSQGLPGLSINWGAVTEIGAAAERKADERIQQKGIGAIAPEQVLEALEIIMQTQAREVGVVPIRWQEFIKQWSAWPFLADWKDISPAAIAVKQNFRQQLEAAEPNDAAELLMIHVRSQIAKVLGLNRPEEIEPRQRLFDLGIDSLMAVELKNRLESSLDHPIRSTVLFDYPTLEALVDYLKKEVMKLEMTTTPEETGAIPDDELDDFLAEIEDISEAEITQKFIRSTNH